MKTAKFRGGLKRQHSEGTLGGDSVPFKTYRRNKRKPKKPPTKWERFKERLSNLFKK